jgi:hypothetical protein
MANSHEEKRGSPSGLLRKKVSIAARRKTGLTRMTKWKDASDIELTVAVIHQNAFDMRRVSLAGALLDHERVKVPVSSVSRLETFRPYQNGPREQ